MPFKRCIQYLSLNFLLHTGVLIAHTVLDAIVIIVCGVSLLAVLIGEQNSYKLAKVQRHEGHLYRTKLMCAFLQAMGAFYKNQLSIDLSWKERLPIFSRGHIFNILGDLVTIIGTIIKINLDYDPCLLVSVLPFLFV